VVVKFKDKSLEAFWDDPTAGIPRTIPPSCAKILYRKLQILNAATSIQDLRIPPGNHLEKLQGNREGQYSIRVNEKWRLCFTFKNETAQEVEFCDYH
jgi:proteic killer suppression protein